MASLQQLTDCAERLEFVLIYLDLLESVDENVPLYNQSIFFCKDSFGDLKDVACRSFFDGALKFSSKEKALEESSNYPNFQFMLASVSIKIKPYEPSEEQ